MVLIDIREAPVEPAKPKRGKAAKPATRTKERRTEVDTYVFIREDLKRFGWVPKNPLRTKDGQVFTQQECLDEPRICEQLGASRPENIVKVTDTEYYVIEGKAFKVQLNQAVKEAEEDYAAKINKSKHIKARIISGVAGNDIDDYLVKSKFFVNGKFEPIISNGKELTSLVSPAIARYLIENNTNIIEELPIDEKLFMETAADINVILHNGAIPATERGKVISALLLSLAGDTDPNVDSTPSVLINDINTRVNALLQREGRPEFFDYIRLKLPTTLANHKKYKTALVRTIQELRNLNIRSAMNSGTDILGSFYEVFLKYGGWAKEIGIVLTPRHITRFAAEILDINKTDLIYDPTCGTGGFLVAAFDRAKRNATAEEIDQLKQNNIFGVDQEASVVSLAIVNMIFRGDGKTNIKEGNCLSEWLNLKRKRQGAGEINTAEYVDDDFEGRNPPITKVLMNPPFALQEDSEQEHKFVDQALAQMQTGGLLFAILPYSELIHDGAVLQWRRDVLLRNNTLLGVVSFTEDLFYPVAGKHTGGIIVKKGVPHDYSKNVLWVNISDDGYVKRKKKRISKNTDNNDLTRSTGLISEFVVNNATPRAVPRFIKASPIIDKDDALELVPEVNLDNREYDIKTITLHIQNRLRAVLSFLVDNGYFPFDKLLYKPIPPAPAIGKVNWTTVKVSDLFDVENGYSASTFTLKGEPAKGHVPLFRPTSSIHNLIAGWIKVTDKNKEKVFPGGSLMVSTDGEGSHSFSYVTPIDFIPNSNTAVLVPKQEIPLSFQLFIAAAISNERWRYSYGRKPKSGRLKNLILKVPVNAAGRIDFEAFEAIAKSCPEYQLIKAYFLLPKN